MSANHETRVKQAPLTTSFWSAALVTVIVTTCTTLPVFLVGALAVRIRAELELPVSRIGLFSAVFFAASAVLSSPAGRVAEGTGAPIALRAAALLGALSLAGIALARSAAAIVVFLVLGGFAVSVAHVASNLYLTNKADPSRQGLAFGIKQAAIPAAILVAGLAVPLIGLTVGWRWAFAGGAVLTLGVAAGVPSARAGASGTWSGTRAPDARLSALIALAVGGGLASSAASALGTYLVASSVAAGVAEGTAGLTAAAGSALGMAARVGAGWLADRATSGRLLWVSAMLVVGALGYALMATRNTAWLLPTTLLCFAGGWGWPGLFNFAVVVRNRRAPAAATGVTQTGVYLGGVLGPLLFGYVVEHTSYAVAWRAAAFVALLASVAILVGRRWLLSSTPQSNPA